MILIFSKPHIYSTQTKLPKITHSRLKLTSKLTSTIPTKILANHNIRTPPKPTKYPPKMPSNPQKSSIPSNNHQINRKFNIHIEINTNTNTNVNITTPFKTPTKPLQTHNISHKTQSKHPHNPLSHRNPKTSSQKGAYHEPKLHIQNHANTQIQPNRPYYRRNMSCHCHK